MKKLFLLLGGVLLFALIGGLVHLDQGGVQTMAAIGCVIGAIAGAAAGSLSAR